MFHRRALPTISTSADVASLEEQNPDYIVSILSKRAQFLNWLTGRSYLNQPSFSPKPPRTLMQGVVDSVGNFVSTNITTAPPTPSRGSRALSKASSWIRSPPDSPPSPSTKDQLRDSLATFVSTLGTATVNWTFDHAPSAVSDWVTRVGDCALGTRRFRQLEDGTMVTERDRDGIFYKIYMTLRTGTLGSTVGRLSGTAPQPTSTAGQQPSDQQGSSAPPENSASNPPPNSERAHASNSANSNASTAGSSSGQ